MDYKYNPLELINNHELILLMGDLLGFDSQLKCLGRGGVWLCFKKGNFQIILLNLILLIYSNELLSANFHIVTEQKARQFSVKYLRHIQPPKEISFELSFLKKKNAIHRKQELPFALEAMLLHRSLTTYISTVVEFFLSKCKTRQNSSSHAPVSQFIYTFYTL